MSNRLVKTALMLCVSSVSLAIVSPAYAEEYRVDINKTEVLQLPYAAGAVIVGNPAIADVSVHSQNTIFIMGRGFGETNLIILDDEGRTIMNADVKVGFSSSNSDVRIIKIGQGNESYSCSPICLQAPGLGDSAEYKENFLGSSDTAITNTTVSATSFTPGVTGNSAVGARNSMPAQSARSRESMPYPNRNSDR